MKFNVSRAFLKGISGYLMISICCNSVAAAPPGKITFQSQEPPRPAVQQPVQPLSVGKEKEAKSTELDRLNSQISELRAKKENLEEAVKRYSPDVRDIQNHFSKRSWAASTEADAEIKKMHALDEEYAKKQKQLLDLLGDKIAAETPEEVELANELQRMREERVSMERLASRLLENAKFFEDIASNPNLAKEFRDYLIEESLPKWAWKELTDLAFPKAALSPEQTKRAKVVQDLKSNSSLRRRALEKEAKEDLGKVQQELKDAEAIANP